MAKTKELFKSSEVEADSVEDFLNRYYKPTRYTGRGKAYAKGLLKSHQQAFEKYGYDIISRHDSMRGEVVAYFGQGNN